MDVPANRLKILAFGDCEPFLAPVPGFPEQFEVLAAPPPGNRNRVPTQRNPDLVLVHLGGRTEQGLDASGLLVGRFAPAPVVLVAEQATEPLLAKAFRVGIRAYLSSTMAPRDVLDAFRNVLRGELVTSADLGSLFRSMNRRTLKTRRPLAQDLSERQQRIAALVARSQPNKAIARHLGVSEQTVKNELRMIRSTLRLNSRVELAVLASGAPGATIRGASSSTGRAEIP